MNAFGDYLYTLRKQRGYTQKTLAEQLNVTDKAVSKWETGEAFPSTELLAPLADILGVTVDELLRGRFAQRQDGMPNETHMSFSWLTACVAILLALSALAFVFFIGVSGKENFTVLDYFYKIYVRLPDVYVDGVSAAILWTTALLGTAISLGAIISVAVFAVITIVRAVKLLYDPTRLVRSAVSCYFCYALGCILFQSHWRMSGTLDGVEYSFALNGVSVAGLAVGGALLIALLALALSRIKPQYSPVDVTHLTIQLVFTFVTLWIFASPIKTEGAAQSDLSFSAAMTLKLYAYLFNRLEEDAFTRYDGIIFALVVYLLTILLLVFLTVKLSSLTQSIASAADKNTLGIDGALCVIMIAYLSFNSHPVSLLADYFFVVPSFHAVIAGCVFICLMFVFSLVHIVKTASPKKKQK